jgi:cytochrome b involved in lipid metabolism
VTYHGEVYDITEFIEAHPGGMQKIMMAAGGSIGEE